jgi:hypothetical protein
MSRFRSPAVSATTRLLPILALLLAFLALPVRSALAAPVWGIEMTHANAYGAQGGVDPYTGSGTTFDRESGFNAYTITVKNTGTETVGGYGVGGALICLGGPSTGVSFTYQWLRDGSVISGATGASYQLQSADQGTAVQCEVTASSVEGATVAVSSSSLVAPVPSTPPPANGEATYAPHNGRVGETVTCETNRWTGSPTSYEFQWLRGGVPITGAGSGPVSANEFAYTLTAADAGRTIQCEVTATNAGGSTDVVSEGGPSAGVLAPPPPANSAVPTLSGTASVGETLSCGEGAWENSPTSYEYQWLRGGAPIAGAAISQYTLVAADAGEAIQCQVTAASTQGVTGAVSAQDVVSPSLSMAPPTSTEVPVVRGFPFTPGKTVECRPRSWEAQPVSYEFQYLRNGVAIAGASGRLSSSEIETEFGEAGFAYTLTTADAGKAIQCEVTATNAGGSVVAISGARVVAPALPNASAMISTQSVSVSDQLPAGLVLAGLTTFNAEPLESPGNGTTIPERAETSGEGWACAIANPTSVTCTRSSTLAPGESYPPISLHVHVSREAPLGAPPDGGATNIATVYGGGASPASASASDPTTIAEVPFGIQSFTTSVDDAVGNPFTQAGGHPFAANATFAFNYMPGDFGELKTAGGSPKDIETELPPGFIGNPQATPTCSAETFAGAGAAEAEAPCPVDTAVGYIHFSTSQGLIVGGRPELGLQHSVDPVYNLVPAPGHPAAFGFIGGVSLAHFTLTAKVRSDGNYGITISSPYTTTPTILAISFTFCENGVTVGGAPGGHTASCAPTSAGSKPFLTSPARCEGPAPVTTLRADTYEQPADYASKVVYTGTNLVGGAPSASESFATGCSLLQFVPEVEFKPSSAAEGGTTQADQPTGATFDLNVPQTSEAEAEKSATPELKDATVALPAGMSVDPSAADGLQACSNAEFGLGSSVEPAVPSACPLASQIGTMEIFEPLLSGAPKVSGPTEKGRALSCLSGVWNGSPGFTYQWLRDGVPIAGASGEYYVLVAADEGKAVQCRVTATNAGGSSVAVDRVADVIAPEPPTAVSIPPANLPAPSGSPSIGGVLSCDAEASSWSGSPTFSYQWLRGGQPIAGANGSEYTLGGEDAGETVQCEVIATTGGGVVVDDSAAVIVAPSPSTEPPLLGTPIHGKLLLGEPLCGGEDLPACEAADASNGKIFRLFLEADDPTDGVILKIPGSVAANTQTGQLTATFRENPQLPFEELKLKLNGGPRAPLASPQTCGGAMTSADLTPWSTSGLGGLSGTEQIEGTPDATPSSSFNVDWDGHGGACPASLPFAPAFSAGMASTAAGVYSSLTVQFSREDREQDLAGITVHTPVGVLANLSSIPLCGEPQASQGACAAASQIGTTSAAVGPGGHPFWITDGRVYLTTGYKGAPFGLSIVVPADAGPFHLGNVVVRASINIDPHTAAITVTSDPLPQIWDGVPLRLRTVNVDIDRPEFMFNATSCAQQQLTAAITGAAPVNDPGEQGKSSSVSSSYEVGGCASLPFKPVLTAATQAKTSRADGASLSVKVAQAHGQADIHSVRVELPKLLPSRLTTLQKACTEAQFNANPAGCPAASVVGTAVADTPVLPVALVGPAYFVSHGGAKFPELIIVLQGDGVTIDLAGETFISKAGVTSSTFNAVPDAPISSFELSLPVGPHSALAANANLCTSKLAMPTTITGQNGAVLTQATKIAVTGCSASKPSVKVTKTRLRGSTLVVTVKTSATGTIKISGSGLKTTTKKNVKAGSHQIKVALTKAGKRGKTQRKKTRLRGSLMVGKQAVSTTTSVKL